MARATAPSGALVTRISDDGVDVAFEPLSGGEAHFECRITLLDESRFEEVGTISFGNGNVLRFRSVGAGELVPSADPHLSHGTSSWEIDGGAGAFAGASGRIVSNFLVSDTGELTDRQVGVIFVPEKGRLMKTLLTAALVAVALSMLPSAATSATVPLPKACSLLKRAEAQTLAGIKVQPGVSSGTSCGYTAYPTGPVAGVFINVESSFPNTILIDRKLGHPFWKVKGIGDQAWGERGYIFARKGKIWVTLQVISIDLWGPLVKKRLEQAARIAISRVKAPKRKASALSSTAQQPPAIGGRERWTGKERKYGGSITEYAGVTYQPNVVLIGGGARAVRGRSPDGLTWTIAGNAPGAADLRVGKIMLATTFAAGRVLKLTRVGPNLRVVLGPAGLTDIFRDAVFDSPKPIPLTKPLFVRANLPAKPPKRHAAGKSAEGRPVTEVMCCDIGMGLTINYQSPGDTGRLSAFVRLYVKRPTVDFHIEIGGGSLIKAGVQLSGVGGLAYNIGAATKDSSGNFKSQVETEPVEVTIPLAGPLAITLTQAFQFSMQLAGQASLEASGDYRITGKLGFGAAGKSGSPVKIEMTPKEPFTKFTTSRSVGHNAFSLGWKLRATVGLGLGIVGTAGAFYEIRPGMALVADGTHPMSHTVGCVKADLDITSNIGVGYSMSKIVHSIVNAILSVLRVKPIPAQGGPSWGPYVVYRQPTQTYCPSRTGPSSRTTAALAASAAKDPKTLVLQKQDFPANAKQRRGLREKNAQVSSYFAEYRYKSGAKVYDVLSWAHVMSPAVAAPTFRELRNELKGGTEVKLPNCCGSKDQFAALARGDNEGELLVRKGGVIWGLSVNTAPVGNWGLITKPEATALLKRFGPKQMKRVG